MTSFEAGGFDAAARADDEPNADSEEPRAVRESAAPSSAAHAQANAEFESRFGIHRDAIFRFLWRLTRNAADAEDLVQETFTAVWRKQEQFEGRGAAEGYLRRTAFRLYLNERGKRKRRAGLDAQNPPPAVVPSSPAAGAEAERRDSLAFAAARIESALADLPEDPRTAFLLFRYEEMTCAEIGAMLGIPAKTIETRVRRAAELLAQALRPHQTDLP